MSTQIVVSDETDEKTVPIRDIISLIALLLGNILISVGAFMALGIAWGILILGVLLVVVAVLFGLNK